MIADEKSNFLILPGVNGPINAPNFPIFPASGANTKINFPSPSAPKFNDFVASAPLLDSYGNARTPFDNVEFMKMRTLLELRDNEIINLRKQLELTNEKNRELRAELFEKDLKIKELKEEARENKEEMKELKRENKELEAENKKLRQQIPTAGKPPASSKPKKNKQKHQENEAETPLETPGKNEDPEKKPNPPQKNLQNQPTSKNQKYDDNSSVLSIRFLPKEFDVSELRKLISQFGEIEYLRTKNDKEKSGFTFANCKIRALDGAQKASDFLESHKNEYDFLKDIASWVKIDKSVLRLARLPKESDADGIKQLLQTCGTVLDVKVTDDLNDKTKKFATVEFEGTKAAQAAKKLLDEMKPNYSYMKDFSCWVVKQQDD